MSLKKVESGVWRRGTEEGGGAAPQGDGGAVDFTPEGGGTKSPSSKSQVGGKWKVEKTQDMPKVELEQFLKEEEIVDREENGDGLQ